MEKLNDQMLYEEVYGAQEKLLAEVKTILAEKQPPFNSVETIAIEALASLGFGRTKSAVKLIEYQRDVQHHKELFSRLQQYKENYPLNKFINGPTVERVCEKYGLYLTDAMNYIDEIPTIKQSEIIKFSFYDHDFREPFEIMSEWEKTERHRFMIYNGIGGAIERQKNKIPGKRLLIIAPEEKIDTSNLVKDGRVLRSNDPIVLQPVIGGYLIVSSWGLESSDPEIINSIHN